MVYIRPLGVMVLLLVVILIPVSGCSGPDENSAPLPPLVENRDAEGGHLLLDYVRVVPDLSTMTVDVIPLRETAIHLNVKSYLTPPNCFGCIEFFLKAFDPVTRIMDLDVTLKNPVFVTGYDVRGILIANGTGHDIINADDYTKLYDDTTPADINPFIAFDTDDPTRAFNSYETDTRQLLFHLPFPPNWAGFDYAIDASWPVHCKEPYEIINFNQQGALGNLFNTAMISVTVHDWQNDVTQVTLDASFLMGEVVDMVQGTGDTWQCQITNTLLPAPGIYRVLVSAFSPNNPGWWLYDYVNIFVAQPLYDNRITFSSTRTGNAEIFIMNPDGTQQTQLTFNSAADLYPDFSPTERKIIYTSDRDSTGGPPLVESELYVYDIDLAGETKVTEQCETLYPTWSTGGNIVYITSYANCLDIVTNHPAYFPISGGPVTHIALGLQFYDYTGAELRYDDAKLVVAATEIGDFIYEVDFPSLDNLTKLSTGGVDTEPTYSPDGTKIAFTSTRESNTDIYLLDLTSMNETRLTFAPDIDADPTWSPDGDAIAYTHYYSASGENTDIWVTSLDGQFKFNLTNDPAFADNFPDWSLHIF